MVGAVSALRTEPVCGGRRRRRTIEDRDDRRVAAACCATADTVPFRLFEALLRSVCVVFIEGAEYRIDLGFGLQLPCVDEVNTGSV